MTMTGGLIAGKRPTSDNGIAITAAVIGVISALASGSVGYENAKSVYKAAKGSAAGFNDYIEVGQAFWDALPISAAVAVIVGMLAAGQTVSSGMLRVGAGLVGLATLAIGSALDPSTHLVAYQRTLGANSVDSARFLALWFEIYGPWAGLLGVIGGTGVGYAVGTKVAES